LVAPWCCKTVSPFNCYKKVYRELCALNQKNTNYSWIFIGDFIQAIRQKKKVKITFDSKEDGAPITRTCAPLDFGPSRRARDQSDRLHHRDILELLSEKLLDITPADLENIMDFLRFCASPFAHSNTFRFI